MINGNSYGCLMARIPEKYSKLFYKFGEKIISDDNLYIDDNDEYGREDDYHVTIKYGFEPDLNKKDIESIIDKVLPFNIKMTQLSKFDSNDEYNVIIFKIESRILNQLNKIFSLKFPNKDSHPEYRPHATIAYVNKDFTIPNKELNIIIPIDEIYYSDSNNEEMEFKL